MKVHYGQNSYFTQKGAVNKKELRTTELKIKAKNSEKLFYLLAS